MAVQPNAVFDPVAIGPDGPVFLGSEKPLLAIYQELNALTIPQRNAMWVAFIAGNPPKWAQDGADGQTWGRQAPAVSSHSIFAIDNPQNLVETDPRLVRARLKMIAVYLLDNPTWLRAQTFGGTVAEINVLPYTPPA